VPDALIREMIEPFAQNNTVAGARLPTSVHDLSRRSNFLRLLDQTDPTALIDRAR
jgi:hypothetical protein